MEYRQIVAVTGLSGLYQLMSTKNDGAIVRSLTDQSVKFVSARIHHITPLESIEIYTTGENVRLHEVLESVKGQEEGLSKLDLSKADNKELRAFFKTVLPEFDEDRVYVSDIKKILKWYSILKANNLLNFDMYKQPEQVTETVAVQSTADAVEEKPVKKAAAQKKKEEPEEAESAEKPVKKAAPKKKKEAAEEGEEKPKKTAAKKKKED
jgi:hypothetical protein